MNHLIFSAAIVAAIAAISTGSARAEDGRLTMVSKTITYGSEELTSDTGATGLLRRIHHTAAVLCTGPSASPLDPRAGRAVYDCRAKATAEAVTTLRAPLVTAAYARRFGAPDRMLAAR